MNDIDIIIESLGMLVDDDTIEAIKAQLNQDREQAAQASAVHVDI
ncbi:MAG: hypothetical protein V6Z89_12040 [Desulfobacter sp.]